MPYDDPSEDALRDAIDQLPQLDRIVYLAHARHGLTFEAIAVLTGEDMAAVERRLADALRQLVRLLPEA